jgi:hypothetical protein
LPETDSIASGLLSPEFFAVVSSLEALAGEPAAPATCSFLTSRAAITGLGSVRQKPVFTTLEQTTVAVGVPTARSRRLTRRECVGKLRMAHGRNCSRAVRRREGGTSRRHFALTIERTVMGNRPAITFQLTCIESHVPATCQRRTLREPKLRSTDRGMAQVALR